ncbi:ATP-binding protein [Actinoallomurus soli]|uniref:ATP-binding protein n=1 Tax=Actinoallomurus soli TaxID=2952535 RepID=UPI00209209D6|nr:LuxR C-terminal-related transcriptional regulator [Actinoallomurus soli]MCO5971058.1 LuxR C-terminal-related transcriptional regulator [Actinoallomurus soli]
MTGAFDTTRPGQIHGVPAEVTSFVGRRHEVAEVKRLLSVSRLVTLSGVGGVGKTRLATRVGTLVHRAFPDGVWLVELAALNDPGLLVPAVCEALRIPDRSVRPPLQVLVDHLEDAQALLILDNCEHLVGECAVLAEALLRACPRLRILATSRQALGVAGEQTLSVPSLPVTGQAAAGSHSGVVVGDAVRLFAERAEAVVPGFTLTQDNLPTVERICHRLDGLPLAIELAAVRLRALSVHQLLARLDDRFRLLTSGSRAVLPRHQTLRALIDWSYGLCTEPERLLWERTSVFSGGLDLEAAETVCAGDGIERDDILELVIGLVDKSILLREEHSGTVRYRLLETIRQYGRERLHASGTTTRVQQRHRDHYRDLITRAEHDWFGPDQVSWFNRLRTEHGNLRAALDHCLVTPGEAHVGLDMASGLLFYWIAADLLHEGRRWLEKLLGADSAPPAARAAALCVSARLAVLQSDFAAAEPMLRESRALARDEPVVLAQCDYVAGLAALIRSDLSGAAAILEDALARHRELAHEKGVANSSMYLATAYSLLGRPEEAVALFEECLRLCEARQDHWFRSYALSVYGIEVWRRGDLKRATELEQHAIRLKQPFDDRLGMALCVEVLAWIAADEGDPERAARLLGALREIRRALGGPPYAYLAGYRERYETAVRDRLAGPRFDALFEEGRGFSAAETTAYALRETEVRTAPGAPADRTLSPLTRRETEVARLVAKGMSNKEIAATLVVAQRTAEGHVERILRKLGFTSRAQIAAWVAELNEEVPDSAPGARPGRR